MISPLVLLDLVGFQFTGGTLSITCRAFNERGQIFPERNVQLCSLKFRQKEFGYHLVVLRFGNENYFASHLLEHFYDSRMVWASQISQESAYRRDSRKLACRIR
jgi:hypothetical protein